MKIHIEEYKGQSIYYEDDDDKFTCEVSIEDFAKSAKRKSLKDMRKEIDQHTKANLNFKPFKVLEVKYGDTIAMLDFTAIRTDGKLVGKGGASYSTYYGKREIGDCFQYSQEAVDRLQAAKKEREDGQRKYNKEVKAIIAALTPADFSKYDLK